MNRRLWIALLIGLFCWKALRTDWVVECEAYATDFHPPVSVEHYTASFTPPVSPIWSPPSPQKLSGRESATWSDYDFFEAGGSYGPVTEPVLRINWGISLIKMAAVAFVAWLILGAFVEWIQTG